MNEPPRFFPTITDPLPAFWEWINDKRQLRYFGKVMFLTGILRRDNSVVWSAGDVMEVAAIASVRGVSKSRIRMLCQDGTIKAFKGRPSSPNGLQPWIVYAGDALVPRPANKVREPRSAETNRKQSMTMKRKHAEKRGELQ